MLIIIDLLNETAHFNKCKQLFEYQHLLLLRDICGLYYKQVMIVIYDHNDIGLYYKTRDDCNWWS